jgi:hypothetical protein
LGGTWNFKTIDGSASGLSNSTTSLAVNGAEIYLLYTTGSSYPVIGTSVIVAKSIDGGANW